MELNYIWNENYPIAIHVDDKNASPQSLQLLSNMEDLPVRHIPTNKSYYPQS